MEIEGRFFDCGKGIIHIASLSDGDAALAHEFRHHLQWLAGVKFDSVEWSGAGDYKREVVRYYTSSKTEMDALLYECRMCPGAVNMEHLEWVQGEGR